LFDQLSIISASSADLLAEERALEVRGSGSPVAGVDGGIEVVESRDTVVQVIDDINECDLDVAAERSPVGVGLFGNND